MARQLPAKRPAAQPEMVVLDADRRAEPRRTGVGSLARTALLLTPDVLRLVESSVATRQRTTTPPTTALVDSRVYTEGVRFTEERHQSRLPWARNVTVRTATAWQTSAPAVVAAETDADASGRLRRAGLLGVGGAAALAACGLLLNRGFAAAVGERRLRRGAR